MLSAHVLCLPSVHHPVRAISETGLSVAVQKFFGW